MKISRFGDSILCILDDEDDMLRAIVELHKQAVWLIVVDGEWSTTRIPSTQPDYWRNTDASTTQED